MTLLVQNGNKSSAIRAHNWIGQHQGNVCIYWCCSWIYQFRISGLPNTPVVNVFPFNNWKTCNDKPVFTVNISHCFFRLNICTGSVFQVSNCWGCWELLVHMRNIFKFCVLFHWLLVSTMRLLWCTRQNLWGMKIFQSCSLPLDVSQSPRRTPPPQTITIKLVTNSGKSSMRIVNPWLHANSPAIDSELNERSFWWAWFERIKLKVFLIFIMNLRLKLDSAERHDNKMWTA